MIEILKKEDCCGCNACVQRCPKQCITMQEDAEGFLYPRVDTDMCIECGICEKVCPVINLGEQRIPLHVYAAKNKNEEIRLQSSSGGIFTLLAEKVIQKGGIVFGARFDENWEVKHDYTETIAGLAAFRGSKYVQSRIENTYQEAEVFLKQGREVLFSGTPCQIAGLKKYLRKEYENLLTVDFICHGVPSPKVWRMYLNETCNKLIKKDGKSSCTECIEEINFRNKNIGWKIFSFFYKLDSDYLKNEEKNGEYSEPFHHNHFMKAFLSDLILRPSCYKCPSKSGKSGSDITIADYWGIQHVLPEFDDDKGVGLVFINTEKGKTNYPEELSENRFSTYEQALHYNPSAIKSISIPAKRNLFFKKLDKCSSLYSLIEKETKAPIVTRAKRKVKDIIKLLRDGSASQQ